MKTSQFGATIPVALLLFFGTFVSYASFMQRAENANVASRMFLSLSLIESHTVETTRYGHLSEDRAEFGDRIFCDKAPGMSLMAVPFLALTWDETARSPWANDAHARKLVSEGWPEAYVPRTYVATLVTSSLLTSLAVVALFLVGVRLFGSSGAAVVAALSYGMATPIFGWSTTFFGHSACSALLFLGFAFAYAVVSRPDAGRLGLVRSAACAAALTLSVSVDYSVAPAAVMVALWAAGPVLRDPQRRVPIVLTVLIAGLISAVPLLIYNDVTFGAPWKIGYGSDPKFPGMNNGFFGITLPKPQIIYEILFGPSRGLLQIAPWIACLPFGIYFMYREPGQRGLAVLVVGVVVYHLLLNASFHYWEGGWSLGPRYITAMLPFVSLALGAAWVRATPLWRRVLLGLVVVSVVISVLSASVGMEVSDKLEGNLIEYVFSRALAGSSHAIPVQYFGLRSRYFLLIFFAVWAVLALLLARYVKRQPRALTA